MKFLKSTLLFLFSLSILSCSSDLDDISKEDMDAARLISMIENQRWSISNFKINGQNETENFKNYVFTFEDDNGLKVNSNQGDLMGTWRIATDSGSEFDSYNDVDFNIYFNSASKLGPLTNNYDIFDADANNIRLFWENPDEETFIELHFVKN